MNTEILGLRNSIYMNNEIVRKKNLQLRILDRKLRQLEVMLQSTNKKPNYYEIKEIVDQRLNDKRSLLVAALIPVFKTFKANPYGLNLLNSSSADIEDYIANDIDGKNLLQFAESCYNSLLKSYAKTIALKNSRGDLIKMTWIYLHIYNLFYDSFHFTRVRCANASQLFLASMPIIAL